MKTSVPPLSLLTARALVTHNISSGDPSSPQALAAIGAWHTAVQLWQDRDDLASAFEQGRLTLRTMTHTGGAYQYGQQDLERNRLLGIINNDDHQRVITNEARQTSADVWEKGGQLPENKKVRLDAGGAGIKRRLDPRNFITSSPKPRSSKHLLGLHDLSASLLDPDGYTLKKYSGTNLVVLMPLPFPEDVKLFYQLKRLSKSPQASAMFKSAIQALASELTRPRLASSLDMGTTYVLTTSKRHGEDSVKYVKGKGPFVTSQESPEQCRTNATENYRKILSGSSKGANEITIAYRKYGTTNKFPCFAISRPDGEYYLEVDIKLPVLEGGFADYEETGYLISGKDFSRSPM